ncbi:hypothetical protein HGO40_11290 [Pseudomonas sp. CG7]|uniref:hypothetical protein n=1 Tax=Pseudomonas sp. CG7 TaxID=191007 RepID=UPI00203344A8|nr:hypothetical protein [Pseudomonas sp. CG7]MCM2461064.1 hypothetical protein [Pseudomonas sp. CG7]
MARLDSFHHYNDGRGKRRVYVNGNEIERVIWCDTSIGVAVFCPYPLHFDPRREQVYTRRLRGTVTVEKMS